MTDQLTSPDELKAAQEFNAETGLPRRVMAGEVLGGDAGEQYDQTVERMARVIGQERATAVLERSDAVVRDIEEGVQKGSLSPEAASRRIEVTGFLLGKFTEAIRGGTKHQTTLLDVLPVSEDFDVQPRGGVSTDPEGVRDALLVLGARHSDIPSLDRTPEERIPGRRNGEAGSHQGDDIQTDLGLVSEVWSVREMGSEDYSGYGVNPVIDSQGAPRRMAEVHTVTFSPSVEPVPTQPVPASVAESPFL